MLQMRFGEELTQAQIGDALGISQMQVSRLLTRLLGHLRDSMLADEPGPASGAVHGSAAGSGPVPGSGPTA